MQKQKENLGVINKTDFWGLENRGRLIQRISLHIGIYGILKLVFVPFNLHLRDENKIYVSDCTSCGSFLSSSLQQGLHSAR